MLRLSAVIVLALISIGSAHGEQTGNTQAFGIHIVDAQTGRGVPLVSLTTTFKQTYVTDSNGYVAFNEPGLMNGDDVWFTVRSPGYEEPPGGFGVRGISFKPTPAGAVELKLKRTNIAERLYRMTGFGIYRDSALLGHEAPIKEPLLNARVTGQDTVQSAIYRGKYYWFWQDTDRIGFGLGCFSMTGAVATKTPDEIDVDRGIDFTYFVDKPGEFARAMADVPREQTNPIWVDGLVVTHDKTGRERLIGRYFAANSDFTPAETGLVAYDDAAERFERLIRFEGDGSTTLAPSGRPFRFGEGGKQYFGFGDNVRVEDSFEAASDPAAYEVLTCLKPGSDQLDRDEAGKLRWHWQRGGRRLDAKAIDALVKGNSLKPDERPWQFVDVETRKPIRMASGSIAWSTHLHRWMMVFTQSRGESMLGEVWFSTASSPFGPWREARRVATHAMKNNDNSFYNPVLHEELSRGEGRFICFEGTFVTSFSGNEHPTPYYDYNNVMYRLDLDDARLKLPEPPPGLTKAEPVGE